MNKRQFLFILQNHLTSITNEERQELINDYESHFTYGLQNGKTEEQIAHDLGDPFELVREILGDRFTIQDFTTQAPNIHTNTYKKNVIYHS